VLWVARRRGINPAELPWTKRGKRAGAASGHGVQNVYKNTASFLAKAVFYVRLTAHYVVSFLFPLVKRRYGYTINSDGELEINPDETKVVSWIFERYLAGDSLGKIAAGLERQGILSPTGKPKWNREAIDKLLSNEKYTGRVLLQKTVSTGAVQFENNGLMERYLYTDTHEAIISDEMFMAVWQEKLKRAKNPENMIGMSFTL
jgi:hypothetical protein